jgi:riboflavin synthase
VGDSISLDGYCQTVTALIGDAFEVEVSPETLAVTTAAQRKVGDRLNLERALQLGDRLGGHLVAGHVDSVGRITKLEDRGEFVVVNVEVPAGVSRYCVPKGSIAIDGISLTINQAGEREIELGIIPHTWANTTLRERRVGAAVNLEADLIGKYVERLLAARTGGGKEPGKIDEDFLTEHGFVK